MNSKKERKMFNKTLKALSKDEPSIDKSKDEEEKFNGILEALIKHRTLCKKVTAWDWFLCLIELEKVTNTCKELPPIDYEKEDCEVMEQIIAERIYRC